MLKLRRLNSEAIRARTPGWSSTRTIARDGSRAQLLAQCGVEDGLDMDRRRVDQGSGPSSGPSSMACSVQPRHRRRPVGDESVDDFEVRLHTYRSRCPG